MWVTVPHVTMLIPVSPRGLQGSPHFRKDCSPHLGLVTLGSPTSQGSGHCKRGEKGSGSLGSTGMGLEGS